MKPYMIERVLACADYIIETNATVRETAKKFGTSKTTIHKDVTERIYKLDPSKAKRVHECIMHNKEIRHLRGGLATQELYLERKKRCLDDSTWI